MKTQDLLTLWSTLSLEDIESQIETGADEGALDRLFGDEEAAEVREYVEAPQERGLGDAVVLLPGFMGSLLSSVRGVTSLLWINPLVFVRGQANLLELSPDGTRDAHPEVDVVPLGAERMVYLKMSVALRRQAEFFEFPYDWRRPIEYNGDLLHAYLERWAAGDPDRRFTLVAHSMGGLVSRAYLARHTQAGEKRIRRLVMLGTPHFGLAGTAENLILGNNMTAIAAKISDQNDILRVVRNMPSVYQAVPAPPELFPAGREYPVNWDVYDAQAWQVEGIRQDLLDAGRAFHELLAGSDPQVEMIEIAGCHNETLVDVRRRFEDGGEMHLETIRVDEGPDSGDATVPLWSARLPSATLYYTQEIHRYLPKRKPLIEATLALVRGEAPDLPTELPAPKAGFLSRDALASPEVEADQLLQRLQAGTASEEDLSKLYFEL